MDAFTMEIAGQVVHVESLFQSTKEYCKPYLSTKQPDFFVKVRQEDLVSEQLTLEQEAIEEGLKIRKFKEPFLERSTIQRRVADHLLTCNILMLHGSTVAVDGKAFLFTAPCGTGKSTHTRLWRELFGDRAIMVNDDKPFLQFTHSDIFAYGSPWSGKHGLASNVRVPLRGICYLQRGKDNLIRRATEEELTEFLCQQTHIPSDPSLADAAYALLDSLVDRVPLWIMECNKELDAASVSYCAMNAEQ